MADFSVDSLKSNLTNPQRTYLFDILIPIPVGGGDSNTLQIRAESSEIPSVGNTPINIAYKATAGIEIAGKKLYDHSWACVFRDGEDHKIYDAMYAWTQQITHDVTSIGVGDPLYKSDVYLTTITTAGATYMKIKLRGAWVQNIGKVALSYATDGTVSYGVTFAFDTWEEA